MKRRADQGTADLSWFETEPGMELDEAYERVKEADKADDAEAMITRLHILVNKSNALRGEVQESKSLRGQSSRKKREVHHDKSESGPVRMRDKDKSPGALKDTQRSPWQEHAPKEKPEPKTQARPNKPRHDTQPSPV